MSGNTFGTIFRITTWGESHGRAVGVVVDGCPAGLALAAEDIQKELDRRRPGQSRASTARKEEDRAEILSGIFEGRTTGTPISILVWNKDADSSAYDLLRDKPRPGHADYAYQMKYGLRDHRGGGRASARETVGRVAAGAVAKRLCQAAGIEVVAYVAELGEIKAEIDSSDLLELRLRAESNPVRCPDPAAAERMMERLDAVRTEGNSLGGIVVITAEGVPAGLGEPVFDKLDADLAKALMSIGAVKGVEIGSGFGGTLLTGSQHNDLFYRRDDGVIGTRTNRSGGIQGGISNGEPITVRVAFKPTATIMQPQDTVDAAGNPAVLAPRGRHDPCVLPRAVPIVEAMFALVLADHYLRQQAR